MSQAPRLALAALACTLARGQDPGACAEESDPALRIACYAARLESPGGEERKWRLGAERDPFTDELSVILRRGAEQSVRTADGKLVRPSLTLTCWRGRALLLSIETGETLLLEGGADCSGPPASTLVTYRIGEAAPVERGWMTSAPCSDVWLDRYDGSALLARALADGDPETALFRWLVPGGQRIARFPLDGLRDLLPHVESACGAGAAQ